MSTATSRPEYADLLARTLPSVIHSEKENERYLAMLDDGNMYFTQGDVYD